MYITGRQTGEYAKECIQKVRRCVTIRSDALFDPDGMKKEKKESAVLDPLDGWEHGPPQPHGRQDHPAGGLPIRCCMIVLFTVHAEICTESPLRWS